jgi:hypothetical protein
MHQSIILKDKSKSMKIILKSYTEAAVAWAAIPRLY